MTTVAKLDQVMHVCVGFFTWLQPGVAVSQSKGCRNHPSVNEYYSQTGSAHECISSIL